MVSNNKAVGVFGCEAPERKRFGCKWCAIASQLAGKAYMCRPCFRAWRKRMLAAQKK